MKNENLGVQKHLHEVLNHGKLKGTGKLIVYAIDQGFELGPDRSFSKNPKAFDPSYHFELATKAGLSAFAAPYGFLSMNDCVGKIPLILKINSNNQLVDKVRNAPYQAITGSVRQALELGCVGIGFTIYPGSDDSHMMYEELHDIAEEAKSHGLFVMVWAYPRGLSEGYNAESSIDVVSYAAHMACLLGANVIKVKIPSSKITYDNVKPHYQHVKLDNLVDRIKHVISCSFNGKKLVLFSGGEKIDDDAFIEQAEAVCQGGGHGFAIGRNLFQRPFDEALSLTDKLVGVCQNILT